MNELNKLRVMNNVTGKSFPLLGFSSKGDDRTGWNVNEIIVYDADSRVVFAINNPIELRKYSLIKE